MGKYNKWVDVKRKADGLDLRIPEVAFNTNDFILCGEEVVIPFVTDLVAKIVEDGEVETPEPEAANDEEIITNEDEDISAMWSDGWGEEGDVDSIESPPALTIKELKKLTYTELKDMARLIDPALKGNASRKTCREIITGVTE